MQNLINSGLRRKTKMKGIRMERKNLLESLKNSLIVSVQAYPNEPLRDPYVMAKIAEACEAGGAAAIRCQGVSDIKAIKEAVSIPVIGLIKAGHDMSVPFITPTLEDVLNCHEAGADIIALDATGRPRPDRRSFEETLNAAFDALGDETLFMGDCATFEDITRTYNAGCAFASTTLAHAGTAISQPKDRGPRLDLLQQAREHYPDKPTICEGSVHTPQDVRDAFAAGAYAVVVGTAITHPTTLTSWFVDALPQKVD